MGARPAGRSHAAVHALTCRLPRAAVHTVMRCGSCARAPLDMRPRCGSGDRAALAFAIVRCGHFQRKERNGQTETRPPPVRAGARALGRGRARPDGHMPRFMRLRAACHEPRFLRLRAVAHAGGRNETDKQGTRPRPYGRGRVFWDAGREHNRALTHTGKGARFGTVVAAGLFLRRGWGAAPGMAAGPSVFRGAAGGAAWRGVWLTGLCAAM